MKLQTINEWVNEKVNEKVLKKDKWVSLNDKDLKEFEQDIVDLIKNAYSPIGGHPNYKGLEIPKDGSKYDVINLDDDAEPEAVSVSKTRSGGTKVVAMGHDGSKIAKSAIIKHDVEKLKKKGYYIEVSGVIKEILTAKGVQIVTDEATVRKALGGKEIEWIGDGQYKRMIGGDMHTKIMLGKPR